jgi:hypothetical protein
MPRADADFILDRIRSHAEEEMRILDGIAANPCNDDPIQQGNVRGQFACWAAVKRMTNGEHPGREIDG